MNIQRGWISFDIGRYRSSGATYSGMPSADLPPLPEGYPGGLHGWMRELAALGERAVGRYGFERLTGQVRVDGHKVALPESFVEFMTDPVLSGSVPTCTSCYWEAGLPTADSPIHDGARLVRFLNDQQGCLFWYLHLLPDGKHHVLCGSYSYDEEPVTAEDAAKDLLLVADDFDGFIARFWIENLAWYEVVGQDREEAQLSPPVRDYVRRLPAADE